MAIDAQSYALVSQAVYDALSSGGHMDHDRFKVVETYSGGSGFYGAIVREESTGQLVVVFRGTEFSNDKMRDVFETSAQMLMQGVNQQLAGARWLVERALAIAKDEERTGGAVSASVTGHSLGGTLAQVMSYEYNLYGETVSAYGAAGLVGAPCAGRVMPGHNTTLGMAKRARVIGRRRKHAQLRSHRDYGCTHAHRAAAWRRRRRRGQRGPESRRHARMAGVRTV